MFNKLGYFKEYYIDNKFIGTIPCDKDREIFGFFGKMNEVLESEIILSNNRKIKKGAYVQTMLFEFCGQTNHKR